MGKDIKNIDVNAEEVKSKKESIKTLENQKKKTNNPELKADIKKRIDALKGNKIIRK